MDFDIIETKSQSQLDNRATNRDPAQGTLKSIQNSQESKSKKKTTENHCTSLFVLYPYRIHGAAVYGNMDPINIPQSC